MPAPRRRARRTWLDKLIVVGRQYWAMTLQPLYNLLFLLPLVLVFEFGMLVSRGSGGETLVAHGAIHSFIKLFGWQGAWLPGAALILTLLVWHVVGRDSATIRAWAFPVMLAESFVCALPLWIVTRLPQASATAATLAERAGGAVLLLGETGASGAALLLGDAGAGGAALLGDAGAGAGSAALPSAAQGLMLAIGAGLFEELVFRLYVLVGLCILFHDVLRTPRQMGTALAVIVSSVLFAACHVQPIGLDTFALGTFAARTVAGVYLSLVFIGRGMGVAVGSHAVHNVLLLASSHALG